MIGADFTEFLNHPHFINPFESINPLGIGEHVAKGVLFDQVTGLPLNAVTEKIYGNYTSKNKKEDSSLPGKVVYSVVRGTSFYSIFQKIVLWLNSHKVDILLAFTFAFLVIFLARFIISSLFRAQEKRKLKYAKK